MTFLEAIQDMFRGEDMNQTLAVIALLAASFLLGLLLHWLFFSFPRNRRQKREIATLKLRNETLEKENKDLSERFTAQSQKMSRVEEEMRSVQHENNQKVKHIKNLDQRISDLEIELKSSQSLAQNVQNELAERIRMYKYAHAEAQAADERAQAALKERETAVLKVEEMKGLIEEVENEHQSLQTQLEEARQDAQQANLSIEELKKDLQTALEQLQQAQAAQQRIPELENTIQSLQIQTEGDEMRIIELDALLMDMRHTEERLKDQLEVYLQREQSDLQAQQEEDDLFQQHLEQAARSIESHGIIEQTEEEMIEDPELLQRRLQADLLQQQQQSRSLPAMPPPVEIDDLEHEEMDAALSLAEQALEREGFYTELHPHLLIEQPESDESDDDIMNRSLEMATSSLNEEGMYEKIDPNEFIEDADLLQQRLDEDARLAATRPRALPQQEPVIELTDEENEQMERSLKLTQAILDSEGFYSYINPEKLIDNRALTDAPPTIIETKIPETLQSIEQQIPTIEHPIATTKYKTEIEKSIAQEIGKSIPMASAAMKDDLKKIEGIGTFIEQKLNHLGIYTYEQISRFDADFIQKIAAAIGFSEKTIYNDRWVEQAQKLMTQHEIQILTKDMNNVNKLFKKDK